MLFILRKILQKRLMGISNEKSPDRLNYIPCPEGPMFSVLIVLGQTVLTKQKASEYQKFLKYESTSLPLSWEVVHYIKEL